MQKIDIDRIISCLKKTYTPACALKYKTPFELLTAVILSAQCTDSRVNMVTAALFDKYRTLDDYANADIKEFENDIKSTGFYKNKAKSIICCAKILKERYNGRLPRSIAELTKLPGVGRKTANVVLGELYHIAEGITVDTHIKRLAFRIGLSDNTEPEKIERDLMEKIPKKEWIDFAHLLILHGRNVCAARKPACDNCIIKEYCLKRI